MSNQVDVHGTKHQRCETRPQRKEMSQENDASNSNSVHKTHKGKLRLTPILKLQLSSFREHSCTISAQQRSGGGYVSLPVKDYIRFLQLHGFRAVQLNRLCSWGPKAVQLVRYFLEAAISLGIATKSHGVAVCSIANLTTEKRHPCSMSKLFPLVL